jgi:catechol 2,3-dioxygenase-like lactoylglutathione lyase family enzyme
MTNLTRIWPCFIVENLTASVLFYTDQLGFEVQFMTPDDDPFFAIVGRENISIMLKAVAADIKPVPNAPRHPWAPWDAYISAAHPETLFEEYQSRGVSFRQPLKVNSDRLIGFEVTDADGYVLFFGRPE